MDRSLVRLAPCPHGKRRWCIEECEPLAILRRSLQRRHQRSMAEPKPLDDHIVCGPGPDDVSQIHVPRLDAVSGDVPGGPAMDAAGVADEVPHGPAGAGGDRCLEFGACGHVGHERTVLFQRGNVLDDLHCLASGRSGHAVDYAPHILSLARVLEVVAHHADQSNSDGHRRRV